MYLGSSVNDTYKAQQKQVRFRQRRENLRQAFLFLKETLSSTADTRIKNAATVKAFEMVFELSWKTLKDLLEYQGIMVMTPRDALKEAFKAGYLEDGQTWIELLDHRNELVHIYNETQSNHATQIIRNRAYGCIEKLLIRLDQE